MRQKIILCKFTLRSYSIISHPNLLKIFKCTNSNHSMATNTKFLSDSKSDLNDIFHSAVKAVSPNEIIKRRVKLRNNTLYIEEKSFLLRENVYLVGFGKAVMGMAVELEKILGNVLKKGIVSIPSKDAMWTSEDKSGFPKLHNSVIEYREGSINNQPDSRSLNTTHDIIDLIERLTETDTLIALVSGGGSALLYMPRPVLDQEDKLELCKKLQNAGADITELNTVRKKLSLVKGGGLARMAYPASIITLILSDIVGDPIDLIASGPTVYSTKALDNVITILKKYNLYQSLEGNNTMALEAASFEALRKKLISIMLRNDVTGNVQDVSIAYAHITSLICLVLLKELKREEFYEKVRAMPILSLSIDKVDEIFHKISSNLGGIVLIGGGEPTVVVTGQGKGGRNQELALRFSLDWLAKIKSYPRFAEYDVIMLSAGTDGQDGPTDATGAFGYPSIAPIMHDVYAKIKSMATKEIIGTLPEQKVEISDKKSSNATEESASAPEHIDPLVLTTMEVERMLPENTLKENDTYNFYSRFKKGADLIKTGITGTNVMDLHFIYIKQRSCRCEIDFSGKSAYKEDILDIHDLHIDESTIEKYKATYASLKFDKDKFLQPSFLTDEEKKPSLNIKIIDENFTDPCCNKKHKLD
ncbi:Glycerate kinase [Formica fusca]